MSSLSKISSLQGITDWLVEMFIDLAGSEAVYHFIVRVKLGEPTPTKGEFMEKMIEFMKRDEEKRLLEQKQLVNNVLRGRGPEFHTLAKERTGRIYKGEDIHFGKKAAYWYERLPKESTLAETN